MNHNITLRIPSTNLGLGLFLVTFVVLGQAGALSAQMDVVQRYDSKPLALNPVWTRLGDVYGEWGSIESVEFSPDGYRIVSGSKYDDTVIMWRTSDGTELWRKKLPEEIERVAWSPDGLSVASASEDFLVRLFSAEDGTVVREIQHNEGIDGLLFSHNGAFLATGEELTTDEDGVGHGWLTMLSMPQAKVARRMDLGGTINSIDFTEDDEFVLAAGGGGRVKTWRVADGELVFEYTVHPDVLLSGRQSYNFISSRFHPDGDKIVVGDTEGAMHVVAFPSGEVIRRFNRTGLKVEIVEWTPDGEYLVMAGHDPFIHFYRTSDILADHRIYTALQVHAGDQAEFLDFNHDGRLLVSAHQDGALRLWIVMSDDPDVNARRHREVSAEQEEAARKRADDIIER